MCSRSTKKVTFPDLSLALSLIPYLSKRAQPNKAIITGKIGGSLGGLK